MKTSRKDLVAQMFALHPSANTLHLTSDDQAFTLKNSADNHAESLKDKKIESFDNPGTSEDESEDAEVTKASLTPRYFELFQKNPAPQYKVDKMQELIAAEEDRLAGLESKDLDTEKETGTDENKSAGE